MERVKVMFETKEGRLRDEHDAAHRQLASVAAARDVLEGQVEELRGRCEEAAEQLDAARRSAKAAGAAAAAAVAEREEARGEAARAAARAEEVEGEMRALLAAVEAQKAASAAKMRQLATLLHDM